MGRRNNRLRILFLSLCPYLCLEEVGDHSEHLIHIFSTYDLKDENMAIKMLYGLKGEVISHGSGRNFHEGRMAWRKLSQKCKQRSDAGTFSGVA